METTNTLGSKTAADISALLRARNPILWIVTREEARAERFCFQAAELAGYAYNGWDCASGISDYNGKPQNGGKDVTDPLAVLNAIRDSEARAVWVLRDLAPWFRDNVVLRALRTLARRLPLSPRDNARAVIILSPLAEVPAELQGHTVVIDFPLPDRAEIAALLQTATENLPPEIKATVTDAVREAAIDAAVGLTEEEAGACYRKSLVVSRSIEPATVAAEKRRVISRERVLEWYEPLPGGLDSVGGLDVLKGWLTVRRSAFSAAARAYGLPSPKGCVLVGVPGCGKSLVAKAIATAWGMPLLKLDMGALKGKFVGESEANIRKALKTAEAVAPCILWPDEIEKALAGATQGAADGGVSADALGALLQWMQERAGSVFMVATSNDVSALPPELLRKGRFDEIFFVDLPTQSERVEILRAALRSHGRGALALDCAAVAAACKDYTGAEISALVPEALFVAFNDGAREITAADLIATAGRTVPLSRTAAEKIAKLREWAATRAVRASNPETTAAETGARSIDL